MMLLTLEVWGKIHVLDFSGAPLMMFTWRNKEQNEGFHGKKERQVLEEIFYHRNLEAEEHQCYLGNN